MFQPNATDQDIWDYHDREAEYHVQASKVLLAKAAGKPKLRMSLWIQYVKLIRNHHTMVRFHIERMKRTRDLA